MKLFPLKVENNECDCLLSGKPHILHILKRQKNILLGSTFNCHAKLNLTLEINLTREINT